MKVIKAGTPPQEVVYRGECHRCRTVVEFKRSEGRVTQDQRNGDFVTVKCPICGNNIHSNL